MMVNDKLSMYNQLLVHIVVNIVVTNIHGDTVVADH